MQPLWKTVWSFLKNLKVELPHVPVIPLLDIHSKEFKEGIQTDIYTCGHNSIIYNSKKMKATQGSISSCHC